MSDEAGQFFELEYFPTLDFFRRAYRRWLWRAMGGVIAAALLVAFAAVYLARVYPWLSGFFCGVLVVYLAGFRSARRDYLREVGRLEGQPVRIRLDADGLTFVVPRGQSRLVWSELSRVDRVKDLWILRAKQRSSPNLIPAVAFTAEAEAFFRARLVASRVPVEG
jgi:hypothetical protein